MASLRMIFDCAFTASHRVRATRLFVATDRQSNFRNLVSLENLINSEAYQPCLVRQFLSILAGLSPKLLRAFNHSSRKNYFGFAEFCAGRTASATAGQNINISKRKKRKDKR